VVRPKTGGATRDQGEIRLWDGEGIRIREQGNYIFLPMFSLHPEHRTQQASLSLHRARHSGMALPSPRLGSRASQEASRHTLLVRQGSRLQRGASETHFLQLKLACSGRFSPVAPVGCRRAGIAAGTPIGRLTPHFCETGLFSLGGRRV
jgi:hypothetical protein